ncbi:hypothetical protein M406DRAFT_75454 [Cryphonectria parasitica EP155]|uniref:AAA+ ATPase domain-containing protein n=1 Tax=Cryphonectria parasitica (strain ATCC 38755 / EP155) TaxID=660469 RepID=A0A9P4XSJ5_CRYP1|nr:uncharacterized protein M406DRAFT_75454 [Cryphonectria parasitica EP155]KAF3760103.1 hypothetical protein M406DRAFT_75454 [Cryphonectria parasitica EP155]
MPRGHHLDEGSLMIATHEYYSIKEATQGIIFLAMPFRGTSFQGVAIWAEPGLNAWALIRGRKVTKLLSNDISLGARLVRYPLVDATSGTLDFVENPLALHRKHGLMNKFRGGCDDYDYVSVARQIESVLQRIRDDNADTWIRKHHYTEDKLRIERLSGKPLSMEQCYINLAIVKQPDENAENSKERSTKGSEGDAAPHSSPFSLHARLKIEMPDKKSLIELPTLFASRQGPDGHTKPPRRILIRGRAGVGKTTLCKKIVHDFLSTDRWKALFNRGHRDGRRLAKGLWNAVHNEATNRRGTLFLLDSLDEISELLNPFSAASSFLIQLLNSPNVIITTRPHAIALAGLKDPDLELETIGFLPDQVGQYLEKTLADPQRTKVKSFLQNHQLVQDLVRIPIQLDALCFTWIEDFESETNLDTMTAIYQAIELKLWKEDIVQLGRKSKGQSIAGSQIQSLDRSIIKPYIEDEILFLEALAFTELHDDVIQFDSAHINRIIRNLGLKEFLPDQILPSLSFLRTSDPSSEFRNQNFHFLHLTYQEYFAARYFVQQWTGGKPLKLSREKITTREFLRKYKYTARYDILWRFVSGLLDAKEKADEFFHAINEELRDLLGPMHQRLVMYCLNEVSADDKSAFAQHRKDLESQILQWCLFELRNIGTSYLLHDISLSDDLLRAVAQRLGDEDSGIKQAAIDILGRQSSLSDDMLYASAQQLRDKDSDVRQAVINMLGRQSLLSDDMLKAVAQRLRDEDLDVRQAAVHLFISQPALSWNILKPHMENFYIEVLRRSFSEHLWWYAKHETSVIWVDFQEILWDGWGGNGEVYQKVLSISEDYRRMVLGS